MTIEESNRSPEVELATVQNSIGDSSTSQLENLIAQATAKYAVKDYSSAAELYSMATELQAETNGEMSPQNADLLYAYGRCLYHVAVSNSDVLGTKVAGEKREESKKPPNKKKVNEESSVNSGNTGDERIAEKAVAVIANGKDGALPEKEQVESKPYFQFTGDENFDDSDEGGEEVEREEADGEAEGEEDDFSNAFEVLDLARLLLQRRLEQLQTSDGKGKRSGDTETVRQLKERLADTHDLQAEISLEGERFPNAVVDLRAALQLKEELFPQDSSLIAEAHFKLSLALEFSSVTQQKDENGEATQGQTAHIDEAMREEAAKEMEAAITSCKIRIQREEAALALGSSANGDPKKRQVTKESIDDVKEMVKDMEQRLVELRQPPVSINDPTGTGTMDGTNPLSGILGSILGESSEAQKARLEEAATGANDLTNLVRKKKAANGEMRSESKAAPGKRKLEVSDEERSTGKRSRMEDVSEDKSVESEDTGSKATEI